MNPGNAADLSMTLVYVDRSPGTRNLYCEEHFFAGVREIQFDVMKVGTPVNRQLNELEEAIDMTAGGGMIRIQDVRGFDALGLRCELSRKGIPTIVGTPTRAYKGAVHIYACREEVDRTADQDDVSVLRRFEIAEETSDPWTLWQENPTPTNTPYAASDQQTLSNKIALTSPIVVIGASQRGRSHAHRGDFRDDYMAAKFTRDTPNTEPGWHVMAVSDGAGSAVYSREGARLVCETAAETLSRELNSSNVFNRLKQGILNVAHDYSHGLLSGAAQSIGSKTISDLKLDETFTRAVYAAYEAIFEAAKKQDKNEGRHVTVRDYNATAICVAMKRFYGEKGFANNPQLRRPFWAILSYWIGDGGAAIYRPNGLNVFTPLGTPDTGEFAGETRFITSKNEATIACVAPRVHLTFVENFEGIVLATDGVTDPFFPSDVALGSFAGWQNFWDWKLHAGAPNAFDPHLPPEKRADALLQWLMFKKKSYHDDRTILLALNDKLAASAQR